MRIYKLARVSERVQPFDLDEFLNDPHEPPLRGHTSVPVRLITGLRLL